jgi:hypothetical protein
MPGTLVITTLSDGTNSTSATNCIQGSAKAWVNYNATTQTIAGSFNVSSVTYVGVASFTINYTTAMPNTNYAMIGSNNWDNGSVNLVFSITGTSTTSATVRTIYGVNNTSYNPVGMFVAVFSS